MAKKYRFMETIEIAAPCSADWNTMIGNDRIRFCGQCNLNVYNLAGMNRDEAEQLVLRAEGRLCVRMYARRDRTLLAENCPVGLAAMKKRMTRLATAVATVTITFFANLGLVNLSRALDSAVVKGKPQRIQVGQV